MRTLCIFLVLAAACTGTTEQTIDPSTAEREIRLRWDQFIDSWEDKDAAACAGFYSPDASHIPPNSAINSGRDAISAFYETLFLDNAGSSYTHTIEALDIAGEQAIEQGHFKVEWTGLDSSNWSFEARSMTHWVLEEGDWMIQRFMFNLPQR